MRNSAVTPSPVASSTTFAGLSLAELREIDLAAFQEEETYRRQVGMNEIDSEVFVITSDEDFSVADLADTEEDRDYASEDIRPSFAERNNEWERKRNRPPRHILRKANPAVYPPYRDREEE